MHCPVWPVPRPGEQDIAVIALVFVTSKTAAHLCEDAFDHH